MRKISLVFLVLLSTKAMALNPGTPAAFSSSIAAKQSPKVLIDSNLRPVVDKIEQEGAPTRPIARIMAPTGIFFDVVVNEVVVVTSSQIELNSFLNRCNGRVISRLNTPAKAKKSAYLVRVDLSTANTQHTNDLINRLDQKIHGVLKVSHPYAKRLLTLMAKETLEYGLKIGFSMDMLLTGADQSIMVLSLPNMFASNI